jgi:hypothetical protein
MGNQRFTLLACLRKAIDTCVGAAGGASRPRRPRFRPSVEALEGRDMPSVILVTNQANAGAGSLRQAILCANADGGGDTIEFDIEPGGTQIIALTSPLPTLAAAVTVDGTSQPGWISFPLITIDGSQLPSAANGLTTTADACAIKGLIIQNFHSSAGVALYSNNNVVTDCWTEHNVSGVQIENAASGNRIGGLTAHSRNVISGNVGTGILIAERSSNNLIEGNYIGTDQLGINVLPNGNGIVIQEGSTNTTIGGSAPGAGNIISGSNAYGVSVAQGCTGTLIQGNLIGIDVNGTIAMPNLYGIVLAGNANTVGGTQASAGNVIAGNQIDGISLGGNGNQVLGNAIGTNFQGQSALPNGTGILISGYNNTVGGTAAGAGNIIAFNTGAGVNVQFGTGNAIRKNSIHDNGQGIAVKGFAGANNNQAAPTLTAAVFHPATHVMTITGSLTSTPGTTFALDFFANTGASQQGKVYLGSINVTTNALGKASFTANITITTADFSALVPYITATATDPGGDTSPLSGAVHDPVARGPSTKVGARIRGRWGRSLA